MSYFYSLRLKKNSRWCQRPTRTCLSTWESCPNRDEHWKTNQHNVVWNHVLKKYQNTSHTYFCSVQTYGAARFWKQKHQIIIILKGDTSLLDRRKHLPTILVINRLTQLPLNLISLLKGHFFETLMHLMLQAILQVALGCGFWVPKHGLTGYLEH